MTLAAPVQASPPRRHEDLFTAEESAAYLRLPNARAFNRRRREHNVKGVRHGFEWMYSREQLDALKKMIFGQDGPGTSKRQGGRR